MDNGQLEKIKTWFNAHVASFYRDSDDILNANIELKEKHSRCVCGQMLWLADKLKLTENQKNIATAIGLLHDVGRFSQFQKYRTLRDAVSINHSLLGRDVIRQEKVLAGLDPPEIDLIEKAVEYHGMKELPDNLRGDTLLFCQLIRDADKIDIYRVILDYYQQYLDDPDNFKIDMELPDGPFYSAQVVEDLLNNRRISYEGLKTFNDTKLLMLSWVYDVNFPATLERIKQQQYLEKVVDFLPANDDIIRVRNHIFDYVDSRIKKQQ